MRLGAKKSIGVSLQSKLGFTLLEGVAVLIIVGIAVAISAPYFSSQAVAEPVNTDTIKSHLRYAQLMAMKTNVVWGIDFKNKTYKLFRNGKKNDTVPLPGDGAPSGALPAGKSATETIAFDSWGIPYINASAQTAHSGGSL